jgi:hypothetical protein
LPRKRLTMRKIREVLRLKAAGLNIREVAEGAGSARTTVYEYLVRAEGAGLSWPLTCPLSAGTASAFNRNTCPESLECAQIYVHADMAIKERALARTTPPRTVPGRYRAKDSLLAFLQGL